MKRTASLTIGVLAEQAGVGVETVRFYERKGLIRKPAKKQSAYREYSGDDAKKIRFIKRAQDLGFTLAEIKGFFTLNNDTQATCGSIRKDAERKMVEIEEKIKDLQRMKESLKEVVKACGNGKKAVAECRLLDCFDSGCEC